MGNSKALGDLKIGVRISQQAKQVAELAKELRGERSYRGIERLVQPILQALLDLGIMVIAALGGRTPKSYSEVGELLADLNLLDRRDAKALKSMAGMRNILVHAYAEVDRGIVTSAAERIVEDAPRIAEAIEVSLKDKIVDPPSFDALHEKLYDVFRGKIKAALLFGGRAKGYTLKGDYDIAVYFGKTHDLYDLGELVAEIAKKLNIDEDKLNLLDLDSAAPEIKLEALQGRPIFLEDDNALFELKVKAILEFLDTQSFKT
jgi:uncharacterized protein YutE (UPF0331/DUF86 family)/predicted nucleotidyltransferase